MKFLATFGAFSLILMLICLGKFIGAQQHREAALVTVFLVLVTFIGGVMEFET